MEGVSKILTLGLEQCAITIYQVAAHSSDEKHEHGDFYQISIPMVGSAKMECNGEQRYVSGEQRLVLSPGYQHRHTAEEETVRVMLIFFREAFLRAVQEERLGKPVSSIEFTPWAEGATKGFRQLAEQAVLQNLSQPLKKLEIEETEWELARLLLTMQDGSHVKFLGEQASHVQHPALRRAVEYIQEHASEDISLDTWAAAVDLSKYHFIRLFREQVGQTPAQYLTNVRMNKAIQLLRTTALDITDIAFETGFGSLGTFERSFKKRLGLSPSQYRNTR